MMRNLVRGELRNLEQQGYDLVLVHLFPEKGRALCINITSSPIWRRSLIQKFLKKLKKQISAMEFIIGKDPEMDLWNWISYVYYHGDQLPLPASLLAVYRGKNMLRKPPMFNLRGFNNGITSLRMRDAPEVVEVKESEERSGEDETRESNGCVEERGFCSSSNGTGDIDKAVFFRSISVIRRELPESSLGWPLLKRKPRINQEERCEEDRKTSVVELLVKFPSQCGSTSSGDGNGLPVKHFSNEGQVLQTIDECEEKCDSLSSTPGWPLLSFNGPEKSDSFTEHDAMEIHQKGKLQKQVQQFSLLSNSGCKIFSYDELKRATSEFSSENLIGEGGCSNVYKGCLPDGKLVAVKVLKSYKEAISDFTLEINILSSLKHKNITPLLGVCIENNNLFSVYDFFSNGSLEENLHGNGGKTVLPWRDRFNVAVSVSEALKYLHEETPQSVIHKDVKSSNILLSDDNQSQLSDFGLAIWMPKDSSFLTDTNVVGTFGYIAPEYLVQGRVSDKLDIYSFGVVILELLSGRRPIGLVQWAKPLLERGNLKELLDPKLDGEFDNVEMHRMVLAASLCISQSHQYRPKASQVLELLRGEKETREWYSDYVNDLELGDQEDDPYRDCCHRLSLCFSSEEDTVTPRSGIPNTSANNVVRKRRLALKDYLKEKLDS